jgi:hypothetical protein
MRAHFQNSWSQMQLALIVNVLVAEKVTVTAYIKGIYNI